MGVCMALQETAASTAEQALFGGGGGRGAGVDLDSAWHAIHYVLTGKDEADGTPLGDAVLGGKGVHDEDEAADPFDMGLFLPADRVRATASALMAIDEARFGALYARRVWDGDGAWELEDLVSFYEDLVAFYVQVAERGRAVAKIFY
jgi:hypothetical protein